MLRRNVAATIAVAALGLSSAGAADEPATPNFLGPWQNQNDFLLKPGATGPKPIGDLEGYVHRRRGVDANGKDTTGTGYIGNYKDPLLTPWASDIMKKEADLAIKDHDPFWAATDCYPFGPNAVLQPQPVIFLQTPQKITIEYERDHQVRHVYMNVPHSKNPKPSWYGESVGHYDGDTLVIDTIGFNGKSRVDRYGTPYSEQLHMVERYRMSPDGRTLTADITYEDPKAFTSQWSAVVNYRRGRALPEEETCAENTLDLFNGGTYPVPVADKPDF